MLYALHQGCRQRGWQVREDHAHHRLHDLRHTFIVRSVLRLYAQGDDVERGLSALSIYVGHAKVIDTYWYLTGIPELMAISELISIRVHDLELDVTPSVRLHGKGRKQRTVPLWRETVVEIRRWLQSAGFQNDQALLPNRWGKPMTRSNVAERLARAMSAATPRCPSLQGRVISPHTLRHTTAMHLLAHGGTFGGCGGRRCRPGPLLQTGGRWALSCSLFTPKRMRRNWANSKLSLSILASRRAPTREVVPHSPECRKRRILKLLYLSPYTQPGKLQDQ